MTLNEREILVVATKIVGYNETDSLKYMQEHEQEMSKSTYYRILGQVEAATRQRLFEIAKTMTILHMQRIDELEKVRKEMWKQYHKEDEDSDGKPIIATRILRFIQDLQPWLSAYHEATRDILEDTVKKYASEQTNSLPWDQQEE